SPVFTLPTYSSISFALVPSAVTRVGFSIRVGIPCRGRSSPPSTPAQSQEPAEGNGDLDAQRRHEASQPAGRGGEPPADQVGRPAQRHPTPAAFLSGPTCGRRLALLVSCRRGIHSHVPVAPAWESRVSSRTRATRIPARRRAMPSVPAE